MMIDIEEKIKEYNNFLEEKLKVDLKDIETCLEDKSCKYKEWNEVKQVIAGVKEFKEKDRDMLVQFDIGNGVFCNGEITDYERTYVEIGLGYLLEMNCEETEAYSDIRMKLLKREIEHLRQLAVKVKVHIKMVLLAINELQSTLSNNPKKK